MNQRSYTKEEVSRALNHSEALPEPPKGMMEQIIDEDGVVMEEADINDMVDNWTGGVYKIQARPYTCGMEIKKLAACAIYLKGENALLRAIVRKLEKKP